MDVRIGEAFTIGRDVVELLPKFGRNAGATVAALANQNGAFCNLTHQDLDPRRQHSTQHITTLQHSKLDQR